MKGASRIAFAFLFATGGCAAVFGIPSDVELETTTSDASTSDAIPPSTTSDVFVPADGPSSETSLPEGACDPASAFGAPTALLFGDQAEDRKQGIVDARLSDDELTVVFSAQTAADTTWAIFLATRVKRTDAFGPSTRVVSDNPNAIDQAPNLSADGKTLTWTRNGTTFMTAKRDGTNTFSNPTQIGVKTGLGDRNIDLFIRPNRPNELWFASGTGAVESNDLFVGTLTGGSVFGELVPNINDANKNDNAPVVSDDGLSLYFAKVREPDAVNKRYFDVHLATRKDLANPFEKATKLAPLVGAGNIDTLPTWISPDNCRLYMWRFFDEKPGSQAIFVASRPPK